MPPQPKNKITHYLGNKETLSPVNFGKIVALAETENCQHVSKFLD